MGEEILLYFLFCPPLHCYLTLVGPLEEWKAIKLTRKSGKGWWRTEMDFKFVTN
jgi:hypothetical protein